MRYAFYDSPVYKKRQAEITKKYWQFGTFDFKKKLCKREAASIPSVVILFGLNQLILKNFVANLVPVMLAIYAETILERIGSHA